MLKKVRNFLLFAAMMSGTLFGCGVGCCALPKGCQLFNGVIVALMEDLGG